MIQWLLSLSFKTVLHSFNLIELISEGWLDINQLTFKSTFKAQLIPMKLFLDHALSKLSSLHFSHANRYQPVFSETYSPSSLISFFYPNPNPKIKASAREPHYSSTTFSLQLN